MEKTFCEYSDYIKNAVKDETIKNTMSSVGQVGHFMIDKDGVFKPAYYPGFTLITPIAGCDEVNSTLYGILAEIQVKIYETLTSHNCVKAPQNALHMTVARLISGILFEKTILGVKEKALLIALSTLFTEIPSQEGMAFEIAGISVMQQGIIAAMVTVGNEESYKRLQALREIIYSDAALCEYGIERKRGFKGHITLFYIEKELTSAEQATLSEMIIKINESYFRKPYPFYINSAEVRRFDNYLSFRREETWPAINFSR